MGGLRPPPHHRRSRLPHTGARLGPPIYQSLALLVVAYVVLFLPQALGAGEASLRQIPPSLEEASRSLGSSWWSTSRGSPSR